MLADTPSAREPGVRLRPYASGAGGLYSTAADYLRFARMLAEGGALDGVRLLREDTVAMMMSDQLAAFDPPVPAPEPGEGFGFGGAVRVLVAVGFLAAVFYYLSRREVVRLPFAEVIEGSADLRTLAGIVFCFGAAAISGLLGLSPAYGAFIAGLVIGSSTSREGMIHAAGPIQSVLMMVFFLSIGLLIDLPFVWENLGVVLVLLVAVTLAKSGFNILALRLLGTQCTGPCP